MRRKRRSRGAWPHRAAPAFRPQDRRACDRCISQMSNPCFNLLVVSGEPAELTELRMQIRDDTPTGRTVRSTLVQSCPFQTPSHSTGATRTGALSVSRFTAT
jgi:hypothetical protein